MEIRDVVSVSMPPSLRRITRKAAHAEGQTFSAFIQDALYNYLFVNGYMEEKRYARKTI